MCWEFRRKNIKNFKDGGTLYTKYKHGSTGNWDKVLKDWKSERESFKKQTIKTLNENKLPASRLLSLPFIYIFRSLFLKSDNPGGSTIQIGSNFAPFKGTHFAHPKAENKKEIP